jgi:hypothetical protein
LQDRDPELFALLSGTAPAELELAAIQGALAAAPATPQERQQQEVAEQIQAILERNQGNPYGAVGRYEGETYIEPRPMNTTDSFLLESLDSRLAAQLKLQATVMPKGNGLSAEDAAWVQQEMMRARQESAEIAYGGGDF